MSEIKALENEDLDVTANEAAEKVYEARNPWSKMMLLGGDENPQRIVKWRFGVNRSEVCNLTAINDDDDTAMNHYVNVGLIHHIINIYSEVFANREPGVPCAWLDLKEDADFIQHLRGEVRNYCQDRVMKRMKQENS